jgi:cytochrome d ubiquinol oxidase subunit II
VSPVTAFDHALPVVFLGLMGFSMLMYVVLDGYDLGVGMWLPAASPDEQNMMVASIGPFWDANETWLVLGVGILLIAFPIAHGMILGALYLPVAAMLIGLILRGVAFDFRVKAHDRHKPLWNRLFFAGSVLASVAQGWMLGRYVTGFAEGWPATAFAALIAAALPAAIRSDTEGARAAGRTAGRSPRSARSRPGGPGRRDPPRTCARSGAATRRASAAPRPRSGGGGHRRSG